MACGSLPMPGKERFGWCTLGLPDYALPTQGTTDERSPRRRPVKYHPAHCPRAQTFLQTENMNPIKRFWAWISLQRSNQLAQIALAIVAIFGYFYTVVPVFQKERLAEQVADYEGQLKQLRPKIAETEAQLIELQQERDKATQDAAREREKLARDAARQLADAQREQTRLLNDLQSTERQLAAARDERTKVARQTEYMVYRYRLPDGTPAVTPEQVKVAQQNDLKTSYGSDLWSQCSLGLGATWPFARFSPNSSRWQFNKKDPTYPFSQKEMDALKAYGAKFPLKVATDCISSVAAALLQRYPSFASEIESLKDESIDYANRMAASKPWALPVQADDVLQALAKGRADAEADRASQLKKNKDEYGDWESVLLPDRRAIFKNNYEVGIHNANIAANMAIQSAEANARKAADDLQSAIGTEVDRLVNHGVKTNAAK